MKFATRCEHVGLWYRGTGPAVPLPSPSNSAPASPRISAWPRPAWARSPAPRVDPLPRGSRLPRLQAGALATAAAAPALEAGTGRAAGLSRKPVISRLQPSGGGRSSSIPAGGSGSSGDTPPPEPRGRQDVAGVHGGEAQPAAERQPLLARVLLVSAPPAPVIPPPRAPGFGGGDPGLNHGALSFWLRSGPPHAGRVLPAGTPASGAGGRRPRRGTRSPAGAAAGAPCRAARRGGGGSPAGEQTGSLQPANRTRLPS